MHTARRTLGFRESVIRGMTRLAREYPKRRRLRALIVPGAAAAQTDAETRTRLRAEQLAHLDVRSDNLCIAARGAVERGAVARAVAERAVVERAGASLSALSEPVGAVVLVLANAVFDRDLDPQMEQHLLFDHVLPLVLAAGQPGSELLAPIARRIERFQYEVP